MKPRLALVSAAPADPLAAIRACQPWNPATRGMVPAYRCGEVNHCPGCGRSHWLIGRMMAECAFCGTALALLIERGRGNG